MEAAFVCGIRDWNAVKPSSPKRIEQSIFVGCAERSEAHHFDTGHVRCASLRSAHLTSQRAAKPSTRRKAIAAASLALAAFCALDASYIHAKAALAQVLLQRAFDHQTQTGEAMKPWPWADTIPVARLTVPGHAIDRIVLEGDSGRTLAFGPGWSPASATPGGHGTTLVSGHRDTHFAFLQTLADGDEVQVQTPTGTLARYRITERFVTDSRNQRIAPAADVDELWLITCWPFNAVVPGGPLRFVARAVVMKS